MSDPSLSIADAPASTLAAGQDSGEIAPTPAPSPSTLRPEVVQSALSFLRHPSVAGAPLSQRVAFLENKGLSTAEVDAALARAGGPGVSSSTSVAPPMSSYAPQYGGYAPVPAHPHGPPPRPTGDWRDWFIMSVVGGGVGYGLYTLGKRWLYPYLQPPSNSALEADLAALNARYDAVEKQLVSLDSATTAAKSGIDAQQAMVTAATRDVQDALKEADKREAARDQEVRQLQRQVDDVNAQLNRMFDAHKDAQKAALDGITNEVKSLKTLFVSRTAAPPASPAAPQAVGTPSATNVNPAFAPPRPTIPKPSVPSWQLGPQSVAATPESKPVPSPGIPSWQLANVSTPSTAAAAATAPAAASAPASAAAPSEPQPADPQATTSDPTPPAAPAVLAAPSTNASPEVPKPTIPAWQLESSATASPGGAPAAATSQEPASSNPANAQYPGTSDGRDPAEA